MEHKIIKPLLQITSAILITVICFFLLSGLSGSAAYVERYTQALDRSRDTVLKLMASSAAASAAITVLPGDMASPIASELAELSKGFLIVLCALYLEKFIITVSGVIAFRWLVPVACGCYILGVLLKKELLRSVGYRIVIFALALVLVVPASLYLSGLIEESYEATISQVIDSAENSALQIQEGVGANRTEEEAGSGLGRIIDNLKRSGDLIANGTSQLLQYFERLLSRFVESMAIMVVISCIIPLLVLLFFAWIVKNLFNIDAYTNYKYLENLLKKREGAHEQHA